MKQKIIILIMVISLLCQNVLIYASEISQKSKTDNLYEDIGSLAKEDGDIYYINSKNQICKINIGKSEIEVVSDGTYEGKSTLGFQQLAIKGKYVYSTIILKKRKVKYLETYICRISKESGKIKLLARGANPIIKGNKIYYDRQKKIKTEYGYYTIFTGEKYSMNLRGKNKKVSKEIKVTEKQGEINNPVYTKKYKYYISKDDKALYKKNRETGEKVKIYKTDNAINYFSLDKNYLLICDYKQDERIGYSGSEDYYIMKTNGKKKILVDSKESKIISVK